MIIAGLTGGIASGKSTVCAFFCDAGARIIDADKIARQMVRQGAPAYDGIVACFGKTILLQDGEIDRNHLGDIIFNDAQKKARLDAIVHPRVFQRITQITAQIAAQQPDAVVIKDIPLLLETAMHNDLVDVIVVYVPEALQLKRLMLRDGISQNAAMARIGSQMPIDDKRKRATMVIDNSGSMTDTRRQTLAVFNRLKIKSKTRIPEKASPGLF